MARNPSPKVFGGPIDGSDQPAPIYYFDAANRPYILATAVGEMVERLAHLRNPPSLTAKPMRAS